MGIYDNAPNATFSEGGNYLNPGHRYLLEMMKMEAKYSRKGVPITVTEWRVHESDDPKIRPGAQASWVPNMQHELSLGNVMMMVAATSGRIDPSDKAAVVAGVTRDTLELCASPEQPLKGRMVEVVTEGITTKEKGQPFTKHRWMITTKPPVQAVLQGLISPPMPQQPSAPVTGAYGPAAVFPAPGAGVPMGAPPAGGGLFGAPAPSAGLFGAPAPSMPSMAPAGAGLFGGAPPQMSAPPVPAVAPPVPQAPAPRWIVHPANPAYEYLEGTQQTRQRQA